MALTGFEGFSLLDLPADGVWRVTDYERPFEPPPPSPPLAETDPDNDESRRWDDPDGRFRTLYCATEAEGAFGEKLPDFVLHPEAVREIEEFLEGEPDRDFAEDDLAGGLDRDHVEQLNLKLGWAPARPRVQAVDIASPRTQLAILPSAGSLLLAFGFPRLDRQALRSSARGLTRGVAGYVRRESTDPDDELRAFGLRYESRHPPGWECWALWEPLPLDTDLAEIEAVTIDNPALRSAAAKLGVPLLD